MSKPTLTLTVESVVLAGSTGRVTLHGTAEACAAAGMLLGQDAVLVTPPPEPRLSVEHPWDLPVEAMTVTEPLPAPAGRVAGPWAAYHLPSRGFYRRFMGSLSGAIIPAASVFPRADNTGWRWDGDTHPSAEAAMAAADIALVARGWTLTDGVTP